MLYHVLVRSVIVLMTNLVFLAACQNKFLDQQLPTVTQAAAEISLAPVQISYEMETFTTTKFENAPTDQGAFMYRNRSLPITTRSAVEIGINEDGTSQWIITKLKPIIDIPSPQANIPADDTPQTLKTIIKADFARFYDKDGKLLHSHQMKTGSFKDLVESLRKGAAPTNIAARIAGGVPDVDISERIANAKKNGHTVTDLGKGVVSVRSKIDRNAIVAGTKFDGKEKKLYSVEMWDTVNKIMLGTRLYDENGDALLAQTLYKYENGRNLTQSSHQTHGTDPRNVAFVTTTDSYFSNLKFVNSITKP
jgi:hypothetical protein